MSIHNGYNYENLILFASKYNCQLIDSKDKIDTKPDYFEVLSRCGHNCITKFNKFIKKKIGIYCYDCVEKLNNLNNSILFECCNLSCNKKFIPTIESYIFCSKFCQFSRIQKNETKNKISLTLKNKIKKSSEIKYPDNYSNILHSYGNEYIRNLLEKKIKLYLTNRNCSYNTLLKPLLSENNKWLPIEIKYSNIVFNSNYYFSLKNNYKNIVLLFVHIENKKYWLFPPNILNISTRFKINPNFKYSEYLVLESELSNKIIEYYNKYNEILLESTQEIVKPTCKASGQIESTYINIRIKAIDFINFEKPISNFLPYNFIINGYKVQEVVCFICGLTKGNNYLIASISKSIEGKTVPFEYEDNHFYWLNERDENTFYVVSRDIMLEKGYIRDYRNKGKTRINISTNHSWLNNHFFQYSTIKNEDNKNKLLKLFSL